MLIVNSFGYEFDFDLCVSYMDDDLREFVHLCCAPCSEQNFFDVYCDLHLRKFSEPFEFSKSNPVW